MIISKNFIRFSAACCFLTVITTLGIHLYFPDPPAGFEERVQLFRNKTYLLNRWWVIVHCLLVIIAMWGFALLRIKRSPGFAGLGFLFFCVFSIAEITRQMFVLFYTNGLREQYVLASDPTIKEALRASLTNAGLLTAPFFGVFILMFALGNLCYGISLHREKGFSKLISVLLILWGIEGLISLGNNFWKFTLVNQIIEKYNYTFQPFIRALLGLWLWKKSATLSYQDK